MSERLWKLRLKLNLKLLDNMIPMLMWFPIIAVKLCVYSRIVVFVLVQIYMVFFYMLFVYLVFYGGMIELNLSELVSDTICQIMVHLPLLI